MRGELSDVRFAQKKQVRGAGRGDGYGLLRWCGYCVAVDRPSRLVGMTARGTLLRVTVHAPPVTPPAKHPYVVQCVRAQSIRSAMVKNVGALLWLSPQPGHHLVVPVSTRVLYTFPFVPRAGRVLGPEPF